MFNAQKTEICLKCGVPRKEHKKRCYRTFYLWDKPTFKIFDSKGESDRYCRLLLLQSLGVIKRLKIQVRFQLSKGIYIADFVYFDCSLKSFWYPSGRYVIEDYKGNKQTDIFKKKWTEMKKKYPKYFYKISNHINGIE